MNHVELMNLNEVIVKATRGVCRLKLSTYAPSLESVVVYNVLTLKHSIHRIKNIVENMDNLIDYLEVRGMLVTLNSLRLRVFYGELLCECGKVYSSDILFNPRVCECRATVEVKGEEVIPEMSEEVKAELLMHTAKVNECSESKFDPVCLEGDSLTLKCQECGLVHAKTVGSWNNKSHVTKYGIICPYCICKQVYDDVASKLVDNKYYRVKTLTPELFKKHYINELKAFSGANHIYLECKHCGADHSAVYRKLDNTTSIGHRCSDTFEYLYKDDLAFLEEVVKECDQLSYVLLTDGMLDLKCGDATVCSTKLDILKVNTEVLVNVNRVASALRTLLKSGNTFVGVVDDNCFKLTDGKTNTILRLVSKLHYAQEYIVKTIESYGLDGCHYIDIPANLGRESLKLLRKECETG